MATVLDDLLTDIRLSRLFSQEAHDCARQLGVRGVRE